MTNKTIISGLIYNIIIFLIIISFCSCQNINQKNDEETVNKHAMDSIGMEENCPCDSIGLFEKQGKSLAYLYIKDFFLVISTSKSGDSIEIKRYGIKRMKLIEVIELYQNNIIFPERSIYADFMDTLDFYKLTYYNDILLGIDAGIVKNKILGYEFVSEDGMDTIKSINNNILVPKKKFKGIVKFEEISNITRNGKKIDMRQPIYIDTEMMKRYGNILGQYKAIMENCFLSR